MERTWMETIQLLGLDYEVGLILLMLVGIVLTDWFKAAAHGLGQRRSRRRRTAPTRPLDAWPSQEWGPSR